MGVLNYLITVLLHPITQYRQDSHARFAAGVAPAGQGMPIRRFSNAVGDLFANTNIAAWHNFLVLGSLGFRAGGAGDYIAYTRYFHMFAAVINDIMLPERKGKLALIDLKDQKTFGVGRVDNFTQRQLMDTYACVVCGYCQDACPGIILKNRSTRV